jgi:type I restriction enzyme R subunit
MSNFGFLKTEWSELYTSAARVEALALVDPRGACFYARRALELAVNWLYAHDPTLAMPYDDTLSALIHEPTFRKLVPQEVFVKTRLVKDLGNEAVHSNRAIPLSDAEQATKEYNGRENLDTETGKNKLDSRHHEKTTFTRFQS